jgi:hypothetical protein
VFALKFQFYIEGAPMQYIELFGSALRSIWPGQLRRLAM